MIIQTGAFHGSHCDHSTQAFVPLGTKFELYDSGSSPIEWWEKWEVPDGTDVAYLEIYDGEVRNHPAPHQMDYVEVREVK